MNGHDQLSLPYSTPCPPDAVAFGRRAHTSRDSGNGELSDQSRLIRAFVRQLDVTPGRYRTSCA
jgi:hypothetical protein